MAQTNGRMLSNAILISTLGYGYQALRKVEARSLHSCIPGDYMNLTALRRCKKFSMYELKQTVNA